MRSKLLFGVFLAALVLWAAPLFCRQAPSMPPGPPASAARILLLPRQVVAGEHASLAVLDARGRLTPNVLVHFSNGDQVTTDATGRAVFAAPLSSGVIFGSITNRPGRAPMAILGTQEAATEAMQVTRAPHVASVADRFELSGRGFCGDADANKVTIGGQSALVLASSPVSLTILPPENVEPGAAGVQIACGKKSVVPFSLLFVGLNLEADSSPIRPGEHRALTVRVTGTREEVSLEARNLAPKIAELKGGTDARAESSGGADNVARFEVVGKGKGSFLISIRLLAPMGAPRGE